jgi:hypothetical protein
LPAAGLTQTWDFRSITEQVNLSGEFADPEDSCHAEEKEMRDDRWIEQQGFSIFDPDIEDEPTAADEPDPIDDAVWPLTLLED